jgi:hypothetical protein
MILRKLLKIKFEIMKLTIIGTGYAGLVTGTCFAEMGNKVYCVDIDYEKIEGLKKGIMPIYEPHLKTMVIEGQERRDLIFTTDIKEALDDSNIIFIAVGTPMKEDGSTNLDYIMSAASDIGNNISRDSLVVVKSTVPVGTCFKVKEHVEKIIYDAIINRKYREINVIYNHYHNVNNLEFTKKKLFPVDYDEERDNETFDEDFAMETELTPMLNNLIALFICYELKICEMNSYAAENVIRQQLTNQSLKKIDELEEEKFKEERKWKKQKDFQKIIENYRK